MMEGRKGAVQEGGEGGGAHTYWGSGRIGGISGALMKRQISHQMLITPSLPPLPPLHLVAELLGSTKRLNINYQDSDG